MKNISQLQEEYRQAQAKHFKLDMSRGKPGADQLALSQDILDARWVTPAKAENGFDCLNYGLPEGIPEARRLFAELLEVPPGWVLASNNASLQLMFDYLAQCMLLGPEGAPWPRQGKVKFLCPAPGYDRHFGVLELLGIEMVSVPMLADGPDMDLAEALAQDPAVKGLICVPKYSNPEGKTYGAGAVRRFASMKTAAPDFRVIWDNAYLVHDLYAETDPLPNVFEAAREFGTEDRFVEVASFSKITFPGGGVSCIAASPANIKRIMGRVTIQTIGPDKLNQLRHANYFKDAAGVRAHMRKHAEILRPKFEAVLEILQRELAGVASWTAPRGGYFISLDLPAGCAKRTVQLCGEAGVALTPAGAPYPYGNDPEDRNIRIAPTFPPIGELIAATELLCLCAKMAVAGA
ncbi:MAG: aminotransferase class I/II-fold pyridoxal phosphate-dependent enzyme [Oscillospiraceae bacterium]|jgi:DNA-binding transcriptional MocR family regulator|nr:aminotransferase class I/II-fold pyridoxal phosphate-dependent enzyme [Oscillospiraceae bacterium]